MKIALRILTAAAAAGVLAVFAGGPSGSAGDKIPPAPRPAHGAVPWKAPPNPLARTLAAGLKPERKETLIHHVHAHLDVFVNGKHQVVPSGVGINVSDPGVQSGKLQDGSTAYGGIQLCDKPCISPLHTHDDSGILHTESASSVPNRLGQFFTEWGVRLTRSCVGGYCSPTAHIDVFVDGKRFTGNPRTIKLTDLEEIAIVIGTPPAKIPASFPRS